VNMPEHC